MTVDGNQVHVFGPSSALGRTLVVERVAGEQVTLRSGDSVWVARLERVAPNHLRLSSRRGVGDLER